MKIPQPTHLCRLDKYTIVADYFRGQSGTMLDVGARDRILKGYLDTTRIHYQSSDLGGEHDHCFDLEKPAPFSDSHFDFVVALDVLEHVESIHFAASELCRMARKSVVIALPNLNSIKFRFRYLFTGRINGKYWLLPEATRDRHRWLTTHADIYSFYGAIAERSQFSIDRVVELQEFGGPFDVIGRMGRLADKFSISTQGLFTQATVVMLQKEQGL